MGAWPTIAPIVGYAKDMGLHLEDGNKYKRHPYNTLYRLRDIPRHFFDISCSRRVSYKMEWKKNKAR